MHDDRKSIQYNYCCGIWNKNLSKKKFFIHECIKKKNPKQYLIDVQYTVTVIVSFYDSEYQNLTWKLILFLVSKKWADTFGVAHIQLKKNFFFLIRISMIKNSAHDASKKKNNSDTRINITNQLF